MLSNVLSNLAVIEDLFWVYGGVPALMVVGLYFTYISKCFQLIKLPKIMTLFYRSLLQQSDFKRGVRPIYVFFASIGGCIGIGNVIAVCTAVQLGGPGAVFWMWVAGFFGMLVKYAEIYLGMIYRVADKENGYVGGPLIYLQQLSGGKYLSKIVAFLFCLYGLEIYIFRTVAETISLGWDLYKPLVIVSLIALVILVGEGGLKVVGKVSAIIVPFFLVVFTVMSLFVFVCNFNAIPAMIWQIVSNAFSPHAAFGAFAGSSVMMSLSNGVRRACYTGDIGIGYASTLHSQSAEINPGKEASMGIVGIFIDTFIICTLSLFLILLTGTWHSGIHERMMVAAALGTYFPFVHFFWPFFIFLLGYSSLISFYSVGKNAARFLFGEIGSRFYPVIATILFISFSYIGTMQDVMISMSITGALLLLCNLYGIVRLSDKIKFNLD